MLIASAIPDDDNPFAGLEKDNEDVMKTLETDVQFLKSKFESQVDGDLKICDYKLMETLQFVNTLTLT